MISFLTRHTIPFAVLSLVYCGTMYGLTRQTHVSFAWLNLSISGSGSEGQIQHFEPISDVVRFSLGGTRVDKFSITESQLLLGVDSDWGKSGQLILSGSAAGDGALLPRWMLQAEGIRSVADGVSLSALGKYQAYSDSQVKMLTLGTDYELPVPWILSVRGFLTHTKFLSIDSGVIGGAGMLKAAYLGLEPHKIYGLFAYGAEGAYRGTPAVTEALTTWTMAAGADFKVSYVMLKPILEWQAYPAIENRILKIGMSLEVNW